ncbi:MAG: hypothetical protein AAF626_10340 [Pseudomonadota bacterium]
MVARKYALWDGKAAPKAPRPECPARVRPFVEHLRKVNLTARAAAHADLFEACAVLACHPSRADQAYSETVIKCFQQATGKRAQLFRPGVSDFSFDEAWLGGLVAACLDEDDDSFRFMLCSRVARQHQRNFAFLIRSVSEKFALN